MTQSELANYELRVLQLLADGATTKVVASQCELTMNTAQTYITRICEKLGAVSRTHAVAIGLRRGLVE